VVKISSRSDVPASRSRKVQKEGGGVSSIQWILIIFYSYRLGVNIKDAHDRTPIHSAFRSSNNLNTNNSNQEKKLNTETDFGNKVFCLVFFVINNSYLFIQIQESDIWQEEYPTKILPSDHPLIYLFAKANGNINATDKYLLTPLHYAVARNNLAGVKQLITLKANIEVSESMKTIYMIRFNLGSRSSRHTSITFSM
jgi:ankyrin repeat protein